MNNLTTKPITKIHNKLVLYCESNFVFDTEPMLKFCCTVVRNDTQTSWLTRGDHKLKAIKSYSLALYYENTYALQDLLSMFEDACRTAKKQTMSFEKNGSLFTYPLFENDRIFKPVTEATLG